MVDVALDDFVPFVQEVTGFDPFPWQRRLARQVVESGWPSLLDLPTGTGKTSTLLIALFALAAGAEHAQRRIALVVDRRIIVDQVGVFAGQICDALNNPAKPVCQRVAARLRTLCSDPDSPPLRVVHLRGGIPRDDGWIGAPDQPTIIASTVDQVGSRLLFRGYGVTENMRPVHAGVLARDTLYLLDEVHLATAFEQTMTALPRMHEKFAEREAIGRPNSIVRMSATPRGGGTDRVFELDDEDRAHPVLGERLSAGRPATLVKVKTKVGKDSGDENHARIAKAAVDRVRDAIKKGAVAVGVVLNRVDTARRVMDRLDDSKLDARLVTGAMRPFTKDSLYDELRRRAGTGVKLAQAPRPIVVVATSCIEAGADLDFDALVTEVASLDALRQRFGRFNRLGRHASPRAWILGATHQLGSKAKPDPVYGTALRETWRYLEEIAQADAVDLGLSAWVEPDAARLATMIPPSVDAPVLPPPYLDMWSETRPSPHPDPDVALWLHGKGQPSQRDVHVVFRRDVPAEVGEHQLSRASGALEFLPPVAAEAVAVAIGSFKRWRGRRATWRWTADGVECVEEASEIRPGDTLVVATSDGGLRHETWNPGAQEAVPDLAEPAYFERWNAIKLRVTEALSSEVLADKDVVDRLGAAPHVPRTDDPDVLADARAAALCWVEQLAALHASASRSWQPLLRVIDGGGVVESPRVTCSAAEHTSRWQLALFSGSHKVEATTEDAVSSFMGAEVSLDQHLRDVEAWAHAFGVRAGVSSALAEDVALAGLLHDLGKADPRFQVMLHGGDAITAAATDTLLAKSSMIGTCESRRRARTRSEWPAGFRHELISLALFQSSTVLRDKANDVELVEHLVASHHGWCRPWIPSVEDPKPAVVEVKVGETTLRATTDVIGPQFAGACASRFRRLCRRYGWHGLAYLEALLRLGDHRASRLPGARPQEHT